MKYPEHIYRKFEIAEKDICGEKHYALVEVKKFLLFKWKKVCSVSCFGFISELGLKWHNRKGLILDTIEYEKEQDEVKFEFKMRG